ncbi:MAG: hypothetical protein IJ805_05825 [Lachnospiraceae bacterium]|nr:hypothetical protein [Lachnospiraceae bacterium]
MRRIIAKGKKPREVPGGARHAGVGYGKERRKSCGSCFTEWTGIVPGESLRVNEGKMKVI